LLLPIILIYTLKAYFEGRQSLFQGLAMEGLEKEWIRYPVLHIDLNVASYKNTDDLDQGLGANLRLLEEQWGGRTSGNASVCAFLQLDPAGV
jgi:hypothetical protein